MTCVTSVTVSASNFTLNVGEFKYLSATVCPPDASCQSVTWRSSNATVASVNATSGLVQALGKGTATIYATAQDGSGRQDSVVVTVTNTVKVTSVSLSKKSLSLDKGSTYCLTATVSPGDATDRSLTWSSSNTKIATVSNGMVVAISKGSASICATANDGSGVYDCCNVTVTEPIKVASVTVDSSDLTLNIGESRFLSATVCPPDASDQSVTWCSNNTTVATVNATSGLVQAVGEGTATIYATANDGSGRQGSVSVTVMTRVPVTLIHLSDKCLSLKGGESYSLTATVNPPNAANRSVEWRSSNERVATVKDDKVTAVAKGSATIYAIAKDGSSVHNCCDVTVTTDVLVTWIQINPSSTSVKVGESEQLYALVSPINASNCTLLWSSDNPSVATVNPYSGQILGISEGRAIITAEAQDGSGESGWCEVLVYIPVSSVSFSFPHSLMCVGDSKKLTVTVSPANATNKWCNYSSSNSRVAKVDSAGVVTAVGEGIAEITVTSGSDLSKSDSCIVHVVERFNYTSTLYNDTLALRCAEYAMLAYDEMIWTDTGYVDSTRPDPHVPQQLNTKLIQDSFINIVNYNYDDNDEEEESYHNVSYSLANKQVWFNNSLRTLVAVIIRGTDGVEWKGNMDITGSSYDPSMQDHYSFKHAEIDLRTNPQNGLQKYLATHGITDPIYLITGHSRGAAVANLLADTLTSETDFSRVFAYTFATPNNTKNPTSRSNIFNFCFEDDFVPQVPLKAWGYGKHGRTMQGIAGDYYENNEAFKADMDRYIKESKNREKVTFAYEGTRDLINYVAERWPDAKSYYQLELEIVEIDVALLPAILPPTILQLYWFFRNIVAPAAMNGNKSILAFCVHPDLGKIARFFILGSGAEAFNISFNDYIYNAHNSFTYYAAIKHKLFPIAV